MIKFITRYPIRTYIFFVLTWSWIFWSFLLTVIQPGGLLHNPPPISYLCVLLGGIGPSVAGIMFTRLIDGQAGIEVLKSRFMHWRVSVWWLSIFIIPGITFLTPFIRTFFGYPINYTAMQGLILPGLMIGITAGFMEEFGWRGFLLPRLLKLYSPIKATLILGLIWGGLWHGYADYLGIGNKWVIIFLLGPVLLSAWSVILTWVYLHTKRSLLLSIVVHASISSSAFIFGQQYHTSTEELLWTMLSTAIALIVSVFIGVFGIYRQKFEID